MTAVPVNPETAREQVLAGRAVAHRAVTEGVNLRYVDVLRRAAYDLADLSDALLAELAGLRTALSELLDYTANVEYALSPWVATRPGIAAFPPGGREIVERARRVLAVSVTPPEGEEGGA